MTDSAPSSRPLSARLTDLRLIEDALACAVRDALLHHKQAGNPIADWQDGRVVRVAPEDIQVDQGHSSR